MNLDNLSNWEKRLCLLQVAVIRFESDYYQAGFQKLGAVDSFDVHVFRGRDGGGGLAKSWEIKPESTDEDVANVIGGLELFMIDDGQFNPVREVLP